jgi:GNAT superfamily N-acetyltransferase
VVAVTRVREATVEDLPDVLNVVDGAALQVAVDPLKRAIDDDEVLVATAEARVLGALVLDGERIEAVAVRRARRGQGIGTALVEAAAARRERLVAEFDPGVRPFWDALGFAVEPADDGRLRGVLHEGSDE